MIAWPRVSAVLVKDLFWAKGNFKLLGIMVAPVFITVLLSRSDATFAFSLIFVNVFLGLFSTSYLIIEEKRVGALLALLTTPLTAMELLLAKFLFNLALCLTFSLMAILISGRFNLLVNPAALLNMCLYAGTTCFIGFMMGIFFKNEQEMSVAAPLVMVLFILGDAIHKVSGFAEAYAFFPDYHLAQLIRGVPLSFKAIAIHTAFNISFFVISLLAGTAYARFYFSNNREKRFSPTLVYYIGTFVLLLLLSGTVCQGLGSRQTSRDGLTKQNFAAAGISGHFRFDGKSLALKPLLESQEATVLILENREVDGLLWTITLREAAPREAGPGSRRQIIDKDPKRYLLGSGEQMVQERRFHKYTYMREKKMVVLLERFCGRHILQMSIDLPVKEMEKLKDHLDDFNHWLDDFYFRCSAG